jgi:hypothetical protein
VLRAPAKTVLAMKPGLRELADGSRVELRVERGAREFMIVIARAKDGRYPVWAPGGWALYRNLSDGNPTRIRVFPSGDPYCYVQFRPDGVGRIYMDSVVYGGYVARSIVLPLPFDRTIIEPFSALMTLAGPKFPRRYFEPIPENYADIRALTGLIRSRLKELAYVDDGAFDENGLPVYIETGEKQKGTAGVNCSGFVKWLADGLLRPLGIGRLSIDELKKPPVLRGHSFSEPFEDLRDPYFGLDWTRNLAASVGRAYYGERGADPLEYEVQSSPFAAVRIPGGDGSSAKAYPKEMKDSGFTLEGLKAALYTFAIDEPGRLYFGSINHDVGAEVRLRQHFHVASFLPQFDESGRFSVVVFESGVESGFDEFVARYKGSLIHLVRLPAEKSFDP